VGLRAGLDRCGKCRLHWDLIPGPSSPQRVAVATELSRPTESQARIVNNSSKYLLYYLFRVVPRLLNFMCRRFGALFHLHRILLAYTTHEEGTYIVVKRRHIKFRRRGITRKQEYKIQNKAKVGNQE